MAARHIAVLAAVLPLVAGCLEGDPNPTKQGATSGTITPGTSGGTSGLPTATPSGACSQGSASAVNVTFRNQTSDRSIDLYWVDYQCMEVLYSTLSPGASRLQPTFVGHPWRLRDSTTHVLYKEFIASSTLPAEVSVP